MKRSSCFLLAVGLALAGNCGAGELDWLLGCWVSEDGKQQEVWVAEGDDRMVGFGVVVDDNRIVFHELLTLFRDGDHIWTYTAHPEGQASASFRETKLTNGSALFVNAEHDYPQEIAYELKDGVLRARISLLDGVKPNTFDKVSCNEPASVD